MPPRWTLSHLRLLALCLALPGLAAHLAAAQPRPQDPPPGLNPGAFTAPVTAHRFFYRGLDPCGPQPPTPAHSAQFDAWLLAAATLEGEPLAEAFQRFLAQQPDSPYGPAVHLALGAHYAQSCRLQRAIDHFTAAWTHTGHLTDPAAGRLADEALVQLGELLVSLGRIQELQPWLDAAQDRPLDGGLLSARWLQVQALHRTLRSRPNAHPLCGTLALDTLARVLGPANPGHDRFLSQPGQRAASTLADLDLLAREAGLATTPVQRLTPEPIPVPSLIHFQAGHFATVLAHAQDRFAVADPALGQTLWLSGEQLNQEASGVFLVPKNFKHPDFAPLDPGQAANFQGRVVVVAYYRDREPSPCDGCLCSAASGRGAGSADRSDPASRPAAGPLLQGGPQSGSRSSGPTPQLQRPLKTPNQLYPGAGMIGWQVSEPELNLWLSDIPLVYQPARGPALILKLDYRQRNLQTIPHLDTYGGTSFGVGWHASWIAWASYRTVCLPGGQQLDFTFPAGSDLSHPDYEHHARQRVLRGPGGALSGYSVEWPDGSRLEFAHPSNNPFAPFFLTAQVDPHGDRLRFSYQDHRLHTLTDADGALTTFGYDPLHPQMVRWVLAPGNRLVRFEPDPATPPGYPPRLRSITDVEDILSTIDYDAHGTPQAIHTPYGTTRFQLDSGVPGQDGWWLDRKIVVTLPLGSTHLYAAALTPAPDLPDSFLPSQLPRNLPGSSPAHPHATLESLNRAARNTFYLGPLQVAATGGATDLENFSWGSDTQPGHLRKARIRHWLLRQGQAAAWLSALNHEQAPATEGSLEGPITWFDYPGKSTTAKGLAGTHNLPALIARVLADPTQPWYLHWTRNSLGHPLTQTGTWTSLQGQWATRTRSFTYDPQNPFNLSTLTDWTGRILHRYTYDTQHRLVRTRTHPEPGITYETRYTYDAQGRLATLTTPTGLVQTRAYGPEGRLQTLEEPAIGRTERFTWQDGHLRTHTDPRGLCRTNTYDRLGRLTRVDYPDATHETFGYLGLLGPLTGRQHLAITQHRDRLGRLTQYEYDPQGRLIQIRDPLGRSTRFNYCACDAVSEQIDPLGRSTRYQHDLHGNRTAIIFPHPDGRQRLDFTLNPLGQILTQTDGDGFGLRFTYNHQGLLDSVHTDAGLQSRIVYDALDHPIQFTDPNGLTLQQTFDAWGRLRLRRYPDGAQEQFDYTPAGLATYTDPNGQRTTHTHDAAGRLLSTTNPNGHTTRLAYHPAGELLELTDPLGRTTRWQYDLYGRWTRKLNQTGQSILTAQYDAHGRITHRWSPAKGTTTYTYDAADNLTRIDYPLSPAVSFHYDALNRLITQNDAALGTTRYTYHPGGQLWTVDGPWDHDTLSYSYTPGGRRSGLHLQQPAGAWTQTYAHDPAGRLQSLQSPAGTFAYDYPQNAPASASTLWQRLRLPNAAAILRSHDTRGRLTSSELFNSAGQRLNAHAYGYHPAGGRLWMRRTDHSRVDYQYDPAGQLIAATGTGGQSTENSTWRYDPAGNLTGRTHGSTQESFAVNARNELTHTPQGTCLYDPNGNLIRHTFQADGSRFCEYAYDDENRLVLAGTDYYQTPPAQRWRSEFLYDGLGRLRLRRDYTAPNGYWVPSGQTRYLYDGRLVLQERSHDNLPTLSFTRGLDLAGSLESAGGIGGLLAQSWGCSTSTGAWTRHDYPHADAGGNITYLLRQPASFSGTYRYDPFGSLTYSTGRGITSHLFSSKPRLPNSGLYPYGHRFYDPNLQRWLNQDPLGEHGGINLYTFVNNDPVNGRTGGACLCI
jgi:RHS repeat-associated protein